MSSIKIIKWYWKRGKYWCHFILNIQSYSPFPPGAYLQNSSPISSLEIFWGNKKGSRTINIFIIPGRKQQNRLTKDLRLRFLEGPWEMNMSPVGIMQKQVKNMPFFLKLQLVFWPGKVDAKCKNSTAFQQLPPSKRGNCASSLDFWWFHMAHIVIVSSLWAIGQ